MRKAAPYGLLAVLTGVFLLAGGSKVLGGSGTMETMARLHFGAGETFALGLLELAVATLLWVPRTRVLALGAVLLFLAGAAGAHLAAGESFAQTAPMWFFGSLAVWAMSLLGGRRFDAFVFGVE